MRIVLVRNDNGGIVPPWLQHPKPPIPIAKPVSVLLLRIGMGFGVRGVMGLYDANVGVGLIRPIVACGTRIGVSVLNVSGKQEN